MTQLLSDLSTKNLFRKISHILKYNFTHKRDIINLSLVTLPTFIYIFLIIFLENRFTTKKIFSDDFVSNLIVMLLIYSLFILILIIFNYISKGTLIEKNQFKLYLVLQVSVFYYSFETPRYLGGLINREVLFNNSFLKNLDRGGDTLSNKILLGLAVLLPLISLLINSIITLKNSSFKLNSKSLSITQIIGIIGLCLLPLHLFELTNTQFNFVVLAFVLLLIRRKVLGNRFIASTLFYLAYIQYYSYRSDIYSYESLSLIKKFYGTVAGTLGRIFEVGFLDYFMSLSVVAILLSAFYLVTGSQNYLNVINGTFIFISIFYIDFLHAAFTSSRDKLLSFEFATFGDGVLDYLEIYYGYNPILVIFYFILGAAYLTRPAFLLLPKPNVQSRYSTLAMASFLISPFGLITLGAANLVSISLAHLARAEIQRSDGDLRGTGLTVFSLGVFYASLSFAPIVISWYAGVL